MEKPPGSNPGASQHQQQMMLAENGTFPRVKGN